ncbi:MAG: hypothetical protein AAF742_02240 [Pseudomonadota bacterium]
MALLLLLPGCAAAIQVGPAAPDPEPTVIGIGDNPTAEILISRASEVGIVTQVVATPDILINGMKIGTCRFDRPLRVGLPAGSYTVTARTEAAEESQWVVLEKGEAVALQCGVRASPDPTPRPRLDRLAEAPG